MNLYELSNRFWQENEYEPFSTSDIALYFYLLHRANSRRWQMPLRCPTAMICCHLKTSRQNIVKARESLWQRGLISFSPGKGKDTPALYTIVENPGTTMSTSLPDELSGQLSDKMTDESTGKLTHGLSDKATVYKDKEIDKDIHNNSGNKAEEKLNKKIGLDELERRFMGDTDWQQSLLPLLSGNDQSQIGHYIHEFFQSLKARGFDKRKEQDCRNHFYNWLRKQKTNNNGVNKQSSNDRRWGVGVPAVSPEEYDRPF